jgi:hypothetical protein
MAAGARNPTSAPRLQKDAAGVRTAVQAGARRAVPSFPIGRPRQTASIPASASRRRERRSLRSCTSLLRPVIWKPSRFARRIKARRLIRSCSPRDDALAAYALIGLSLVASA